MRAAARVLKSNYRSLSGTHSNTHSCLWTMRSVSRWKFGSCLTYRPLNKPVRQQVFHRKRKTEAGHELKRSTQRVESFIPCPQKDSLTTRIPLFAARWCLLLALCPSPDLRRSASAQNLHWSGNVNQKHRASNVIPHEVREFLCSQF
jgi:hypothetical protein